MMDWIIGISLCLLLLAMVVYGIKLEIEHRRKLHLITELDNLGKQIRLRILFWQNKRKQEGTII